MRAYFTQLRQELGGRLVEKVFGQETKPSKVQSLSLGVYNVLLLLCFGNVIFQISHIFVHL